MRKQEFANSKFSSFVCRMKARLIETNLAEKWKSIKTQDFHVAAESFAVTVLQKGEV